MTPAISPELARALTATGRALSEHAERLTLHNYAIISLCAIVGVLLWEHVQLSRRLRKLETHLKYETGPT